MGYYCTVPQCTSLAGKTKNVKFHRFPRDESMADKWNVILKRGKPYTKYSKVCSLHFTQADYNVTTMGQWKTLSKDAVPSQNLPKLNADGTVMVIRKSRTVKYREAKKDDFSDKTDKWSVPLHHAVNTVPETPLAIVAANDQESNIAYRLQTLNTIANTIAPQNQQNHTVKVKKQDAFMQTDPVQSEEDDTQPNNSYSETSEKSYTSEQLEYPVQFPESAQSAPELDMPKDYTKNEDDYIPQTNEEYNKEAEKYALERKSHNGYDKPVDSYQKGIDGYQKGIEHPPYPKIQDVYGFDKGYPRSDYVGYPNDYQDSVEMLRNQQHNLQILQEQHRITENQNFFNESHIKQEVDINNEDDKFMYERAKDQIESNPIYENRLLHQQRLMEQLRQVKQEPETSTGTDSVMQPQGSPYYQSNGHTNVPGTYYEGLARPGPELLIAKQNALAAHTQLWQNTMKRPFFYSDSSHYNAPPILHRYEDIPRILQ